MSCQSVPGCRLSLPISAPYQCSLSVPITTASLVH
ncbi:unnamed protein product, partial [Staurois parvus]